MHLIGSMNTRENILTFNHAILAKLQMEQANSNLEYSLIIPMTSSRIARRTEYFNQDLYGKRQAKRNKITKQIFHKIDNFDREGEEIWKYGNPRHVQNFLPLSHEKYIATIRTYYLLSYEVDLLNGYVFAMMSHLN